MSVSPGAAEELQQLRRKLKESEEQVQQAAQAGLDLLNQQLELQTRLEEQRVEMTNAMEVLEQEKYSLQMVVELKTRMLDSLQSDYDCVKGQHKRQLQQQEELQVRSHHMELNDLKNKIIWLQSELEESQLNEKQLKHKLGIQAETLDDKMEELRALTDRTHNTLSSEMMEVEMKTLELENAKVELEKLLLESQCREQQLELTNGSLQRQFQQIMGEREREAVSWFNALEKSRELNQDLQLQLDQVLQQAQDPNSKGNSLFAELEDKRAEMERQLISMKVQHQSLQKQHVFSQQQLHRMKMQIAMLMQLQGTRADPAQLERLQSMLSEKNGEIQNLMSKLQRLEKVEMLFKSRPPCPTPADGANSQDETYYIDLLQMKLNNSVKDAEHLGDELSLQRMKSLSESQRALELERKLFSSEQLLKQAQSDKIKLQLRVEELQHKYEPNEVNKNHIQKRRREKLPVDMSPAHEGTKCKSTDSFDKELEHLMPTKLEANAHFLAENKLVAILHKADMLTQDSRHEPSQATCVRISEEPPVTIPHHSRSHVTDHETKGNEKEGAKNEQQYTRQRREKAGEEGRRRRKPVEVIHISGNNSMENQCAQQ